MHYYVNANTEALPSGPTAGKKSSQISQISLSALHGAILAAAMASAALILIVSILIVAQTIDFSGVRDFIAPTTLDSSLLSIEARAAGGKL